VHDTRIEPLTYSKVFRPMTTLLDHQDGSRKCEICIFDLYYIITFYYIRAVRAAVQLRHVYYRKYVKYTSVIRVM